MEKLKLVAIAVSLAALAMPASASVEMCIRDSTKHGGIALCAPIAPYMATRRKVREMVEAHGGFVEVYVSTSLAACEARDRKGLYAKARAGLIKEFTLSLIHI